MNQTISKSEKESLSQQILKPRQELAKRGIGNAENKLCNWHLIYMYIYNTHFRFIWPFSLLHNMNLFIGYIYKDDRFDTFVFGRKLSFGRNTTSLIWFIVPVWAEKQNLNISIWPFFQTSTRWAKKMLGSW